MIKNIEYVIKHNLFIQQVYKKTFSLLFRFLGLFIKAKPNRVFFQSLIGKTYSDSPRVLFEKMLTDREFQSCEFVWAFVNPEKFNVPKAKLVKLNSLEYFVESLKCGIWITNVDIERGLNYKPNNVRYLNTGHGVSIKFAGNAQKNRSDYDYSDVDFMCSENEFMDNMFIKDFNIKRSSLKRCGMPRNDVLYNIEDEYVTKIKNKLNLPLDKKIILYAPTWRDSNDGGESYLIKPPIDINYWKKMLGKEYILLFRMHHLTTKQMGLKFDDFIRDFSGEYDINDLMIVSDILISDYSATIFDYSILEKPIYSFAYDYEDYKKNRGVYFDLREFFGDNFIDNQEDLINSILKMDYEYECMKTGTLKRKYMNDVGNATEICIQWLKDRLNDVN